MKRTTLPYGVQDYRPDECYAKNWIEQTVCGTFASFGYDRVETPTLEYGDIYGDVMPVKRMFKLTDNDGSLLVLRPDITLQVCRMASRMEFAGVRKLYYADNSFEYLPNVYTARTREFAQAGVELLGDSGVEGDAEIVSLAIESFLRVGLTDFLIEIGDVRFFKCLMNGCGMSAEAAETVKNLVDAKDQLGLEMFLQNQDMAQSFKEKFLLLPSLFGGVSVLDEARRLCGDDRCAAVLDDLKRVSDILHARGYGRYISFDLGLLSGLNYYSGLVVKGLSKNMGLSLLDGGRYDDIGHSFRKGMNAVGFAIGIQRLLTALGDSAALKRLRPCEYAYGNFGASESFVNETISRLRAEGHRVTNVFAATEDELRAFAARNGIGKVLAFTAAGVKTEEVKPCNR